MSKSVYLLVMGGFTEAWYGLSADEQADLSAKAEEADKRGRRKMGAPLQWALGG